MMIGAHTQNLSMWEKGILLEIGYELGDVYNMVNGYWPFDDGMMPFEVKVGAALHHLPATLLFVPIFHYGLQENIHLQQMCASLLLPSGLTAMAACFGYSMDITQPRQGLT